MKLKFWLVFVVVMLAFLAVGTVYATFSFGTLSRTWRNPGYRYTLSGVTLSANDKSVCMDYSVNGAAQATVLCTCSGTCPDGPNATYTCDTAATNFLASTVAITINSRNSNNSCAGQIASTGPVTTLLTGTTAVTLAAFDAQPQSASWLLPVGLALLTGTTVIFVIKRRRA
jgi:hypothetical protein